MNNILWLNDWGIFQASLSRPRSPSREGSWSSQEAKTKRHSYKKRNWQGLLPKRDSCWEQEWEDLHQKTFRDKDNVWRAGCDEDWAVKAKRNCLDYKVAIGTCG